MTAPEVASPPTPVTRPAPRVLFIIYGLEPAGPELRLLEFARGFPPHVDVHVCVIGDSLTLLDEFRTAGAKMLLVPVRKPWTEWGQLRRVMDYVRRERIEIINSFDLKTLLVAAAVKLRFGRRVKLVHHLISLWDGLGARHQRVVRAAMRLADVILCNGYAVRDTLIGSRRMKARVEVVPNGVDLEYFRPVPAQRRSERSRLGFSDSDFVFGAVSNVRPVKNYELLLRTMQRLMKQYPHVRLVCVGGGPQLSEMQALAHTLGIGDRVTWTGQVTDIRPYVATFDAYVLTSLKEGCPNSLMQAMAMGVASATARVGEVDYLTDRGRCALVFDVQQPDECFAACAQLVSDDALRARLAAAGHERMRDAFAHARMLNDYITLFRESRGMR